MSWWAIRRTHSRIAAAVAGADSGCKIKLEKQANDCRVRQTCCHHFSDVASTALRTCHFALRTSHLSLRTSHQAIESAPNCLNPVRHPPWPSGMREAIKSSHRALGATVGAVFGSIVPLTKPYPLSRSDIPLPTGAPRFRRATINSMFFDVFTSGPRC